ncbi:unnamed protein product, partial [Meganyctiphanes norvegica]
NQDKNVISNFDNQDPWEKLVSPINRSQLLGSEHFYRKSNDFSNENSFDSLGMHSNMSSPPSGHSTPYRYENISLDYNSGSQNFLHSTDLVALMEELAVTVKGTDNDYRPRIPTNMPQTPEIKGCVFCKNNGYHGTFYKSHMLKRGSQFDGLHHYCT